MESIRQMRRAGDGKIEMYEMEIFFSEFSEAEKRRFLNDMPRYLREVLERQGHTVNKVLVTTDFERRAREEIARSQKGSTKDKDLMARWYHTQLPEAERSVWI